MSSRAVSGAIQSNGIEWDLITLGQFKFTGVRSHEILALAKSLKQKFGQKLSMFLHPCRKRGNEPERYCLQFEYEHDSRNEGESFQNEIINSFRSKFGKERVRYDISHKSIEI